MYESNRLPANLRSMLAATSASAIAHGRPDVALRPLGAAALDQVLGGGLARGRLHEVFARDAASEASAIGFAAMLALRLSHGGDAGGREAGRDAPIFWLREAGVQARTRLYGPGLVDLGLDPARLILGVLPDARAILRAGADILRGAGAGAGGLVLILELGGNPALLDLTASRRLALAAEQMGHTPLLLRLRGASARPSAAQTRWEVASAPSVPLATTTPGAPALSVTLLRQRGGPAGQSWRLEWDRDTACFADTDQIGHDAVPAFSGARLSLSGGRSVPSAAAGGCGASAEPWRLAS